MGTASFEIFRNEVVRFAHHILPSGGCGGRTLLATFESVHPQQARTILSEQYEIAVRVGLHCAPLAHQALGTLPDGAVRFSLGHFKTLEDVELLSRPSEKSRQKWNLSKTRDLIMLRLHLVCLYL